MDNQSFTDKVKRPAQPVSFSVQTYAQMSSAASVKCSHPLSQPFASVCSHAFLPCQSSTSYRLCSSSHGGRKGTPYMRHTCETGPLANAFLSVVTAVNRTAPRPIDNYFNAHRASADHTNRFALHQESFNYVLEAQQQHSNSHAKNNTDRGGVRRCDQSRGRCREKQTVEWE